MTDPSLEEEGLLREWAPLTNLLQQIPAKAQRGIFTQDLNLTCVDTLPDFIAVGTNLGLVYWYSRRKGDLQRLRCENTASAITCVKVISTVDFMVAAGNDQGIVTVFQIPKMPPDSLPESMKPKRNKQDNAKSHTSRKSREKLQTCLWEVLLHPSYSPNVISLDFHLFGPLRIIWVAGTFSQKMSLKRVLHWFRRQDISFYSADINALVERYTISGLHTSSVTAIEWSMNGMKLFSGDKNGLVVLTEIDFYMHLSKSLELLNEKYEIVQLSYSQQLLLVSTLYRSIVCHREDRWRVSQVGQKERKALGKLGATFCLGAGRPQELVVYSSRPGLRVWLADKNGIVQQTLIYKDTMMLAHTHVPLINPAPAHVRQTRGDHQFGPLLVFRDSLLVTFSNDAVYVLNPANISVVATVADLRKVQGVSVTKDEIFILEGERSLVRVAYSPESTAPQVQGTSSPSSSAMNFNFNSVFVRLVGGPMIQAMLADEAIANKTVWTHVAAEMARAGFSFGENAATKCHEKWIDIIQSYNEYAVLTEHKGKERPSYFDTLEKVLTETVISNSDQISDTNQIITIDSSSSDSMDDSQDKRHTTKRKRSPEQFLEDSSHKIIKSKCLSDMSQSHRTPCSSQLSKQEDYSFLTCPVNENTYEESSDNSNVEEFCTDTLYNRNTVTDKKPLFYLSDDGKLVPVFDNSLLSSTETHDDSLENTIPDTLSDDNSNSLNTTWDNTLNRSRDQFELKVAAKFDCQPPARELVITPKPNQPIRPVPTAAEAMTALILRLNKDEKRREAALERHMEDRWEQLTAQLNEQSMIREQLLNLAVQELSCIACEDEQQNVESSNASSRHDHQPDVSFMSIPVSLSDVSVASSLMGFTSKIKDSAVVPAIPFHKINLFGKLGTESEGGSQDQETSNPVVTADEAMELPPIVAIPAESLTGLMVEKSMGSPAVEDNKVYKEVYNRSQRGSTSTASRRGSSVSRDSSRAELLDKIGAQQFEDVVFKPKQKKRRKKRMAKNKHLMSGAESGSDTMSTNSVRSNTSDGEDPWSSERLDISSDWSSISTRPSSSANNERVAKRSSSEETLVRLGDSIISELGTLPPDLGEGTNLEGSSAFEQDNISPSSKQERRPEDLHLNSHSLEKEAFIPECIQPDLRSPSSIERDVANKERILAQVLNIDTLYIDKGKDLECDKVENGDVSSDINKTETNCVSSHSCILSEESTREVTIEDCRTETCETQRTMEEELLELSESQDEKLASFNSLLSYGPPSGSSAPPSTHASLEICPPSDDGCETRDIGRAGADSWVQDKTPEGILHFALSNQYVCCIDSRDNLYYSNISSYGFKWQKVDGKATKIAISSNGAIVWKLKKNIAYALMNPSSKGPFGDGWVETAIDVQSIAVDDNIAWFISLDNRIYVQKFLTPDKPHGTSILVCCLFPATHICCFQTNVWVLTSNAKVLNRCGISSIIPDGKEWMEVSVPFTVVDIALGCHGTGWIVDSKNVVYFTKDFTAKTPQWWQILISDYIYQQTTPLQHLRSKLSDHYLTNLRQLSSAIVAAGEDMLCISERMAAKVHFNKIEFTGHQWCQVPLKYLSPSMRWDKISAEGISEDKGNLWMLSTTGDLFSSHPDSSKMYALPLPFNTSILCLAATPEALWLLTSEGKLFVRQVLMDNSMDGVWKGINLIQLVGIFITHVSCSNDAIWACDNKGDIYMAIGSPQSMASKTFAPAWIQVDEKPQSKTGFTKVYVGPQTYMVWALDKKKNVYVREGILPNYQLGREWVPVSGIEAVELSISETGVWALSPRGSVYRRYGVTQKNYIGDYWKKIPGSVRCLTASVSDGLWALDKNATLLRHCQLTIKLSSHGMPPQLDDPNPSSDGDWLMV